MKRLNYTLSFLLSFVAIAFSQDLTVGDYQVGPIQFDKPIKDILSLLPVPKNVSMKVENGGISMGSVRITDTSWYYSFDSLMIQTNRLGAVIYFEFTAKNFTTARDIRIGDRVGKVWQVYGPSGYFFHLHGEPHADQGEDDVIALRENEHSLVGISFYLSRGRVVRIAVGWGTWGNASDARNQYH